MQRRQIGGERVIRLQIMARPSLVELLDQFAEEQQLSRSAAIASLLSAGLEQRSEGAA